MTHGEAKLGLDFSRDLVDDFCVVETYDGFGILRIEYDDRLGKCFLWYDFDDFMNWAASK